MERAERIELSYSAWKAAASPLCHARLNGGWSWYRARWASDNGFTDRPRSLRDYPSMQLSPGSPQAMPAECLSRCCRKVVVPRVRAGTEAARYSLRLRSCRWVCDHHGRNPTDDIRFGVHHQEKERTTPRLSRPGPSFQTGLPACRWAVAVLHARALSWRPRRSIRDQCPPAP